MKKGTHYYFLDADGNSVAGPFAGLRPYSGGYAAVVCYEDVEKKPEDTYNAYINRNQILVHIREYDKKDELKRMTWRLYRRSATGEPCMSTNVKPTSLLIH